MSKTSEMSEKERQADTCWWEIAETKLLAFY